MTGAGGFIGRHVVRELLDRGYEVDAVIGDRCPFEPHAALHLHRVDLLDESATARWVEEHRPGRVLHLAWIAAPGIYWTAPENERWLSAGVGLLRALSDHGCERAVGVGSCAEYDWSHEVCVERSTPMAPSSVYGRCKDSLRLAFESSRHLSTAWARIFYTFGPGEPETRLVPSVIQSLLAGQPVRCTAGTQERDFLYVREVASALIALLQSDVAGPVNIASGSVLSVRALVTLIATLVGAPDRTVVFGALPIPAGDPPRLIADVRRLHDEVGWTPATSLADGLAETIAWWRTPL